MRKFTTESTTYFVKSNLKIVRGHFGSMCTLAESVLFALCVCLVESGIEAIMAHGARTRAAANRLGYSWRIRKLPQTVRFLAVGRFLQEERGPPVSDTLAKLAGDTSDVSTH